MIDEPNNTGSSSTALIAGALSGVVGMLSFLIVHHFWILPIWFIMPFGLVVAVLGGLAVGWAYIEVRPRLPSSSLLRVLVMIAIIAVILAPGVILAEVRAPFFDIQANGEFELVVPMGTVIVRSIIEVVVTAVIVGALVGWWLGRSKQAVVAMALGGFIFVLGPGHNIPLIGGTHGVPKELALMAAIIVPSAVTLVYGHLLLSRANITVAAEPVPESGNES